MSRKKKITVAARCAVAALLAGVSADRAAAQVNAIQSGAWEDPNTWDLGAPPTTGNNVAFPLSDVVVTSSALGNTSGFINVASQPGVTGAGLIVTGGSLTVSNPGGSNPSLIIGQPDVGGSAFFQMSGGTVNVSLDGTGGGFRDFIIGDRGATASGTMTGGTINAGDQFIIGIGANGPNVVGSGTFTMSNATINTGGVIDVGFNSGQGTMIIGAGSLLQAPTSRFRTSVGDTNHATISNVQMTGGTINVGDAVVIGSQGSSTMTMSGGVINSIKGVVLNVNGSNVTTTGNNDFVVGDFNSPTAVATLNISGTATINVGFRFGLGFTGAGASGVVNQSGGAVNSAGFIVARANGAGTSGIYNMTGGTITQTGNATLPTTGGRNNDLDFIVGQGDTSVGVFNQSGGSVSAQNVFLGDFDRSQATYKISGGSLAVATDMYVGSALAANAPVAAYNDPTHITIPNGQAQAVVATLQVVGHSASAITVGRDFLANPIDRSTNTTQLGTINKATLEFDVGDATGTTLIQVGNVADLDGAVIDMKAINGFAPTPNEAFSLFSAKSFMTNSVTFAAEDANNYTFSVVPGGNGLEILQAIFQASTGLNWNQAGGTWDTNPSNQAWQNSSTLAAASYSEGSVVNFTDAAVGSVTIAAAGVSPSSTTVNNSSGTYTFTGGGILTGSLTKSNAGTLVLANGANTFTNMTVSGGQVSVGGASGATAPLAVSGTLNVADGAKVSILQAATPVANTVNNLNLNTSGTLDLANHTLLVTTTSNVASYVARAAGPVQPNGLNAWTGSGLTSSLVQADAATGNTKQLAVGYFDSRDNANTGLSVPAGQTLVKETVYGDATGDGKVNIADLSVWNNNFGVSNPRWSQGDFNYDGKVNIADLSVWNNNFGGHLSGPTPPAGAVAAAASVKLTSSASAASAATPPAGTLELDIDPSTGDAKLNSGGLGVAAIEIDSASGILVPGNWKSLKNNDGYTQWAFPRGTPNASQIAEFVSDPSPSGQPANLAAGTVIDYGDIFPVGFTNVADLTFSYNLITDPTQGLTATRVGVIVVPEPTGLALAGVAAAGLLGRKRRRAV